jgi:hypothetical protein
LWHCPGKPRKQAGKPLESHAFPLASALMWQGAGGIVMKILQSIIGKSALGAAAGALLVAGCAPANTADLRTASLAQAGAPALSVTCEPSQRAVVRPVTVNGVASSEVACVTVAANGAAVAPVAFNTVQPVAYQAQPAAEPETVAYARPAVYQPARPVPVSYTPAPARRVVETRQVPVERRASTRSVKKSAIIIGSSAGAGAGLGAVIGGKKGALIGAAIGGGGATLWDQITRRKQ